MIVSRTLPLKSWLRVVVIGACCAVLISAESSQPAANSIPKFRIRSGELELQRSTHPGSFFDVAGRRAAVFGYEGRDAEVWVYPLEIIDGLSLSFRLQGYPVDIDGRAITSSITVRPEATTFTYAHAAFTVREILFTPLDDPGTVILLDVESVLPMTITVSFRPRLRLMWPAPSMTPSLSWDPESRVYALSEETGRYAGLVGCPLGRDVSIMPYQEEPRDIPNRFTIDTSAIDLAARFVPIVVTGSIEGRASAKAAYDRILASVGSLYEKTADYYERVDRGALSITTPEPRLDTAFRWAKIGIDKGLATNPALGTGLLAGFRTAGESERPGYAWFFGRDALWTSLATTAEGAFDVTRTALEFLRKYQRQDGKIPHEISQSASLIPWFEQYPYAWASADATPLYVVAHADYWHASGDRDFVAAAWPSVKKAYDFSAATDTDGNGLIENTNVGHGWVEGGALYPAHEEIYMQGLWIAASQGIADLADVMQDARTGAAARAAAERTRKAMEQTYWLPERGFYAFATRPQASSLPRLVEEDTVLPAVPLWFRTTDAERAQQELDHLGSGTLATDWGSRILSNRSAQYDPLSYHYGSVWPLFTGWTAVGAYRFGRPHVGYGALMANALLTYPGALGYVTELLSGDFATPFGRSSHHQIWSEAMVVSPVIKGLLGIDVDEARHTLRFAPSLPATWDRVDVREVAAGADRYHLSFEKSPGRVVVHVRGQLTGPSNVRRLVIAPAFPTDARMRRVTVNGAALRPEVTRVGDEQRAQVTFDDAAPGVEVVFDYDEGTAVEADPQVPQQGAANEGLRILRAWADANALHLRVEGRGGRTYVVRVRSPRRPGPADGVTVLPPAGRDQPLAIRFDGTANAYVRRDVTVPLSRRLP